MTKSKLNFELVEYQGLKYPVVKRLKGKSKIDECPYCGRQHTHSPIEGHRNAHCDEQAGFSKEIIIGDVTIPYTRGYFLKEY